jgi:integrase
LTSLPDQLTLVELETAPGNSNHIRDATRQEQGEETGCDPRGSAAENCARRRRPDKAEILRTTLGEPWTTDGFKTSWGKAFDRAGLDDEDLHFHDLRGTAVTRLALSGCTVLEIAAITGHSPRDVEAILEAHYLGGRVELAEQAIAKLGLF